MNLHAIHTYSRNTGLSQPNDNSKRSNGNGTRTSERQDRDAQNLQGLKLDKQDSTIGVESSASFDGVINEIRLPNEVSTIQQTKSVTADTAIRPQERAVTGVASSFVANRYAREEQTFAGFTRSGTKIEHKPKGSLFDRVG
jgi:hypothetical protein